jgi:tetratricopeptide (TPR) repeat protein
MPRDFHADMETLSKVLRFAQERDFERATQLAEQTMASGFEHPMLLNIVATRLEQQGKFEDSLRLLQRAVAIAPADIGARNALSLCLQRLDRPAEALAHADELLKRHPELPFAHASKGNALIALGELGRAKQSHLRALELEPGNLAAAASLASIATHRGAHEEARRWAEQALKLAPGFPDAVISLAAADLACGDNAAAETRLQQLILDSRAGPADRARATGLLADVLDSGGRYAEAFDAYGTCNEALLQIHPRFPGTRTVDYARALNGAMQRVHGCLWQPAAGTADKSEATEHVFLLGFPRTGTTLLEVLLDGHPRVVSTEELELLTEGVLHFMCEPLNLEPLARARDAELRDLRRAYWDRVKLAGIDVAGKVFIDKHPLNTLKLPLIARLFPNSKILFAIRDPRDVVLSCFRRRFKMNPAMYEFLTLPGTADFYDAVMDFAETARQALGLPWHIARYESLVTAFEQQMGEICGYVGLEWDERMRDFSQRVQSRETSTPSTAQLSRGLVSSGIDQWRHYQRQLEPILPTLKRWVQHFGYLPA